MDIDDGRNIESLVVELRTSKELDNRKLLLDVLPRSTLGHELDNETVREYIIYRFYEFDCMINYYDLFLTDKDWRFI